MILPGQFQVVTKSNSTRQTEMKQTINEAFKKALFGEDISEISENLPDEWETWDVCSVDEPSAFISS